IPRGSVREEMGYDEQGKRAEQDQRGCPRSAHQIVGVAY
ncbi:unnamed protein product, partial [Urochloa humidicola]